MARLTNLTNGPFDIQSKAGGMRLPALGTIEGDFDDDYLATLNRCGMVKVEYGDMEPAGIEPIKRKRGRPRKVRA